MTNISAINESDFIFFSSKTKLGTPGKAVKINHHLVVPFVAAVDPNDHEGQQLIRKIEGLSALANSTDSQSASAKTKIIGAFKVSYLINSGVVYITNFQHLYRSSTDSSGLFSVNYINKYQDNTEPSYSNVINSRKLFINGVSKDKLAAAHNGAYHFGREFDLFYTSTSDLNKLGAWSLQSSAKIVDTLVTVLKKNQKNEISVCVEGLGAHVLSSAVAKVDNLKNYHFKLINPVSDVAQLTQDLSEKKASYTKDVIEYSPGSTLGHEQERKAAKVALGYSRLNIIENVLSKKSDNPWAKVIVELCENIKGLPQHKLSDNLSDVSSKTLALGTSPTVNYRAPSLDNKTFVDMLKGVVIR